MSEALPLCSERPSHRIEQATTAQLQVSYGGEDAFFVSAVGGGAIGVADGVGGWVRDGVNPADYSKSFMAEACKFLERSSVPLPSAPGKAVGEAGTAGAQEANPGGQQAAVSGHGADVQANAASPPASGATAGQRSAEQEGLTAPGEQGVPGDSAPPQEQASTSAAEQGPEQPPQQPAGAAAAEQAALPQGQLPQQQVPEGEATPQAALAAAHALTNHPGSTTALVLQLSPCRRRLVAANLGDSGFAVVRGGRVVHQSEPLQHFFDCPLQFAASATHTDLAENAATYDLELRQGDLILAATDGVWDNLHEHQILELLPGGSTAQQGLQQAAEAIAAAAQRNSVREDFDSPYIQEAVRQGMDISWWEKVTKTRFKGGKLQLGRLSGGKIDDITVVLALVDTDDS